MTPIEKVARALCEEAGDIADDYRSPIYSELNWKSYKDAARAAIQAHLQALSEPTEEMVFAFLQGEDKSSETSDSPFINTQAGIRAMISSCLGEKG